MQTGDPGAEPRPPWGRAPPTLPAPRRGLQSGQHPGSASPAADRPLSLRAPGAGQPGSRPGTTGKPVLAQFPLRAEGSCAALEGPGAGEPSGPTRGHTLNCFSWGGGEGARAVAICLLLCG